MHVLRRSKSDSSIHLQDNGSKERPPTIPRSPAYDAAMATFAACEAALLNEPTQADLIEARRAPEVMKYGFVNYGWGGALSRTRRAQRRAIAMGATKTTARERVTYAMGPLLQVTTLNLSFLAGGATMGGARLVTHGKKRSADGLREDKMLRILRQTPAQVVDMLAECTLMSATGHHDVWQQRTEKLSQRFDALEKMVTTHPSERLRGSPSLRNALSDVAEKLERVDLSRTPRSKARYMVPRG